MRIVTPRFEQHFDFVLLRIGDYVGAFMHGLRSESRKLIPVVPSSRLDTDKFEFWAKFGSNLVFIVSISRSLWESSPSEGWETRRC